MTRPPGGDRLDPAGREALLRWQRRLRRALIASIVLLGAYWLVVLLAPDAPWLPTLAIPFAAPLVLTGLALQYSGRCPRCGEPVGLRSMLTLPPACPHCGVEFPPR